MIENQADLHPEISRGTNTLTDKRENLTRKFSHPFENGPERSKI